MHRPATYAIVADTPVAKHGVAAAVNDAAREIGAAAIPDRRIRQRARRRIHHPSTRPAPAARTRSRPGRRLTAAACGSPTAPDPPPSHWPNSPRPRSARQHPGRARAGWPSPRRTLAGHLAPGRTPAHPHHDLKRPGFRSVIYTVAGAVVVVWCGVASTFAGVR